MRSVKKFVNIFVLFYLLFALLLVFNILNRSFFIELFNQENLESFYSILFLIGCVLLVAELVVEALYIRTLKREMQLAQLKINELKATLYDQKQEIRDLRPDPLPDPETNVARTVLPEDRNIWPQDPLSPPYTDDNNPR